MILTWISPCCFRPLPDSRFEGEGGEVRYVRPGQRPCVGSTPHRLRTTSCRRHRGKRGCTFRRLPNQRSGTATLGRLLQALDMIGSLENLSIVVFRNAIDALLFWKLRIFEFCHHTRERATLWPVLVCLPPPRDKKTRCYVLSVWLHVILSSKCSYIIALSYFNTGATA